MRVLSFGELLLRLAAPGYTRLFQKELLEATFCGGEANVAVSLAMFGIDSCYMTKLPDNDIGEAAVRALRAFGVDVSNITKEKGRMGLYYLEKGASQRASKVIYDRACSVFSNSDFTDYDWEELFNGVTWFHWTGITPALGGNLPEICEKACKIAKKKNITVSCDLNYRKNLWSSEQAKSVMRKIMPYVDVCIANEEDADKVLGINEPKSDINTGNLNTEGYSKVASRISKLYGCKYVAITMRESISANRNRWSGLLYDKEKNSSFISKKYDIDIVDRVGGGDSFSAGIIYGLINELSSETVIEFATAASCLKHSIEGDFNRVSVEEVNQLVEYGGNGRIQR